VKPTVEVVPPREPSLPRVIVGGKYVFVRELENKEVVVRSSKK